MILLEFGVFHIPVHLEVKQLLIGVEEFESSIGIDHRQFFNLLHVIMVRQSIRHVARFDCIRSLPVLFRRRRVSVHGRYALAADVVN